MYSVASMVKHCLTSNTRWIPQFGDLRSSVVNPNGLPKLLETHLGAPLAARLLVVGKIVLNTPN